MAGEWRRTPYGPRHYEAITTYVPGADGYSPQECEDYLATRLDGFLGRRSLV